MNSSDSVPVPAHFESNPTLPLELEREIFKLAFDPHDPLAITNRQMILVAKRVYNWFRPELYRVMRQTRQTYRHNDICYPDFTKCPGHIDRQQICGYAKHLLIAYTVPKDEVSAMLPMCPGVENLAFWGDNTFLREWGTISKLKNLRQLSGSFGAFTLNKLVEAPFALHLTHLEVMLCFANWQFDTSVLSKLPNLSHLALSPVYTDFQMLTRDIRSCDRIRVLIIYIDERKKYVKLRQLYAVEPRMVLMGYSLHSYGSWLIGTRGGYDMWRWAESIIYARKLQYFKSNDYQRIPISDTFPWREYLTQEGLAWYEETVEKALTEG